MSAAAPELSSAPPKPKRQKFGKIGFEPLTDDARTKLAGTEGALVPAGFEGAAGLALQPGDAVVEAAHRKVKTVEELEARLDELRRMGRTEALLTVEKPGGSIAFASLPLDGE